MFTLPKIDKSAFTLAEVFITLGIIGIVSAITLPTLMNKIDIIRYKSAVKKNFVVFSNALNMITADGDDFRAWDFNRSNEFVEGVYNKMSEHLKVARVCGRSAGCIERNKIKNGNYSIYSQTKGGCSNNDSEYRFVLNDGTAVAVDIWLAARIKAYAGVEKNLLSDNANFTICVDVNGNGGPNVLGRDVHLFVLTSKGLVPAGADDKSKNCDNKDLNPNYDCTAKFVRN